MGHHASSRRTVDPRHAGMAGLELVVGLAVAVACGLLWAVVAYYLEREFVYAALGVGLAVGFAVASTVKEPNIGHGVSAAGLSAIGLLLGKFLIIQWMLSGTLVNEVVNQDDMMTEAAFYHLATYEDADPQVRQWYLDETETEVDPDSALALKLAANYANAQQMVAGMNTDDKLVMATAYTGYLSDSMSVADKIKIGLSFWDLLFFGLAMLVAFQIGRGIKGDEGSGSEEVEPAEPGPTA